MYIMPIFIKVVRFPASDENINNAAGIISKPSISLIPFFCSEVYNKLMIFHPKNSSRG